MAHRAASNPQSMFGTQESGSVQPKERFAQTIIREHRTLLIISVAALIGIGAAGVTFARMWPFTPHGVTTRIQQHSSATIEYESFHELFLPHPGFVAEGVVLRRSRAAPPSVSIKRLTVLSTYSGLIGPSKSIASVDAEGLVVHASTQASQNLEFHEGPNKEALTVEHLAADGSLLEVTTGHDGQPLQFRIFRLRMDGLGEHSASRFEVELQNPKPAMQIAAQGKLGPWQAHQILHTPVDGTFAVSHGELGSIPGVDGALTGAGRFAGELGAIKVSGRADVAGFELRAANHRMPLRVQYDSVINTSDGQVTLHSVDAQLGNTDIRGAGAILPKRQESPDLVKLTLACDHGRIDDLLRLFVSSPKPALNGPIVFSTKALVERGDGPFLKRVRLIGNFEINNAHFTSPHTQSKLDELSARSEGDKKEQDDPPDREVSTVAGDVNMKDGIASLSRLKFQVAGADANGAGTFNVITSRVHIDGKLRMKAELSQSTKGVKSFFLKLLDPIFKKRNAGAEVPVHLTGTSQHPHFKAGLK